MGGDDHGAEELSVQGLKILAIFIVLICGIIGAALPVLFAYYTKKSQQETEDTERSVKKTIKVLNCLAIGIVLASAMIHMLPEALYHLQESGVAIFADKAHAEEEHHDVNCSAPTTTSTTVTGTTTTAAAHDDDHDTHDEHGHPYPYGFLFCMCGLLVVYMFSSELNWYATRKLKEISGLDCNEAEEERQGSLIKLWILEVGVAVHSVIIGITLGIAPTSKAATTLFIVLAIHQAFEGLAIAALVVLARVSMCSAIGFVMLFACMTPVGIIIGIGIFEGGNHSKLTQGVFESISAGILLHMALTEMLPHVFGSHSHHSHGPPPLAKIHDHLHNHSHGHQHEPSASSSSSSSSSSTSAASAAASAAAGGGEKEGQEEMKKQDSKTPQGYDSAAETAKDETTATVIPVPSGEVEKKKEDEEEKKTEVVVVAKEEEGKEKQKEQAPASPVSQYHDDHEDDESTGFRAFCYFAMIVGCAIQSILGIWA